MAVLIYSDEMVPSMKAADAPIKARGRRFRFLRWDEPASRPHEASLDDRRMVVEEVDGRGPTGIEELVWTYEVED